MMKVLVSTLVLCTLLCGAASNIAAQEAVLLIDRSGSMLGRCADVVAPATADVNAFFAAYPGGDMIVTAFNTVHWFSFPGTSGNPVDQANALAEVALFSSSSPVPWCEGDTPLADAVCWWAHYSYSGNQPYFIYLHTDGGENASDQSAIFCWGPADADSLPPWDPGSYQAVMLDFLISSNVVMNVTYYGPGIPVPSSKSVSVENSLVNAANPDYEFLVDVAAQTGGSFTYVTDAGTVPTQPSTWGRVKSLYNERNR